MIERIIRFSIHNKLIIGLFTLLLAVWGVYSLFTIPINAVPDITNNQVQVITVSPTLAAQEVEQYITQPVELSMRNLPGVIDIRSVSRFGLSVVTVVFEDNMGIYKPRQLVSEQLKEAEENIGAGLGTPGMGPISTGLGEIYQYTVEAKPGYNDRYNATELRTIQDWIIKRQLAGVPGVVEVNSVGGYLKQYEIAVDPNQLNSYNLTFADLYNAIEANNQNTGGSYIENGHNLYYVRARGLVASMDDIRKTVVTNRNGIPVTVGDVATVQIGHAPRYGAASMDGKGETVIGVVMMLRGANSIDVIDAVRKRITEIQKSLPEGVVIKPFVDRTKLIDKTTSTIRENLTIGGLIVIFVLVFLLGTMRAGLIVASIIPLSLLFALGMINLLGVSANLMSLGALDFGIIVDGAVIIVEFMTVRLALKNSELRKLKNSALQKKLDDIAQHSAGRMMSAATFGQIIILIVFIPILTLQGVEGKMFIPMALTFAFAILGAMILCLTYVPMMSSSVLYNKSVGKKNVGDKFMAWLDRVIYQPVIKGALRFKTPVIIGALILLCLAIYTFLNMGGEFIPKLQEGDFAIETHMSPGTSLEEMEKNMSKLEKILLGFPEVQKVVSRIGAAEVPTDPDGIEVDYVTVVLKPKRQWKSDISYEKLADEMKDAINVLPGVSGEFSQPIELRFNELLSGVKSDLAVKIYGDDLDLLQQKGNQAASIIQTIQGAADVRSEQIAGLPQIVVDYNRGRLAQYGLQIKDLNTLLRTALSGAAAGKFYQGDKRFDIVIRLKKEFRRNIESIRNLYVALPSGGKVPLKEVADVHFEEGPNQISRDDTHRRIVVGVNVRNRDIRSLVKEIRQKLDAKLNLPPGYYITYGGEYKNLQRATQRLSIVVPGALILIFIILLISLHSFKQTLLIYTAIPFAAIGGVFALWVRGMPFSISAGVGFIALFGVAVLNGLVLISYLNDLKAEGVADIRSRILEATRSRLRPIFLTATVDILGFMPMAVSTSAGAEVQRPLATVVIGGLITSTLLTLVLLPLFYSIFEKPLKMKKTIIATAFLLAGISFPQVSHSQTADTSKLTLEEAIQATVKNNPGLQASYLRIEQQRKLEKTALDPGKTRIYTGNEEVSPSGKESVQSVVGIGQSIKFPTSYLVQHKFLQQQSELSRLNYAVDRNELIQEVSIAYFQWGIDREKMLLYQYLDSIYDHFYQSAVLRYQTGEASGLEKLAAKSKEDQIKLQLDNASSDYTTSRVLLERWMNSKIPDSVIPGRIKTERPPELQGMDSLKNNTQLAYQQAQVMLANQALKIQKTELLPDIDGEYAKQKINGENGFYAWQLGISFPLFFGADEGRIRSAKIEREIQEKKLQDLRISLQATYQKLSQQFRQYEKQLQYYEKDGLPLSSQLIDGAGLSFKTGEIGYVEYLQNIERATEIRLSWLETLTLYNQTILTINYLLTGK